MNNIHLRMLIYFYFEFENLESLFFHTFIFQIGFIRLAIEYVLLTMFLNSLYYIFLVEVIQMFVIKHINDDEQKKNVLNSYMISSQLMSGTKLSILYFIT